MVPRGKLVVAVVGMPGAGKSLVVNAAVECGYSVVVMGDEVREEAKKQNLPATPENVGRIMLELRRKEDEAVIAKRCVPKIEKSPAQKIIVDGIRSLVEVEEFTEHFENFTLVGIHSSPETRFRRLFNRGRADDPLDWEIFRERDVRELSVGLGSALALSEYLIVNEGEMKRAKSEAKAVLRRVETSWMK